MNTHINSIRKSNGSVLLTTLALTGCIGIMLTGTLFLMSNQNYSIRRSQIWNLQIPAVEAGIEEAMCHLNKNCYVSDLSPSGTTPQWYGVDGWIASGYRVYSKSNTLPDGSYYIDTIVATDPNNVKIFSEGHVFGASLCMNLPQPIFATSYEFNRANSHSEGLRIECGTVCQWLGREGIHRHERQRNYH